MMRWILQRAIGQFEKEWSYDASYLHEIAKVSPQAAWLFSRVSEFGKFRREVPLAPWCAAGITAVRAEDCGPCTQLAVTMAERAGVDPGVLRALLAEDVAAMPEDVALVWRFTRATLAHDDAADGYREEVVKRWGQLGLVSLVFAITASRMYPTVKYAMGYGKACTRVEVSGETMAVADGHVELQPTAPPANSNQRPNSIPLSQ